MNSESPPPRWKTTLVALLALGSLAGAFFLKPIPQDPAYHRFADQRTFLSIPHFLNVVSNLPFLVSGLFGLWSVLSKPASDYLAAWVRWPWLALTVGIFLTGFGSSYYHWDPGDSTLFWDRLPMAIGFGAMLGIIAIERIDLRTWGTRLWVPLLIAGPGSLLYARWTGDLRFYGLLQGWVIILVPLVLLLFPARYTGTHHWFLIFGLYGIAKVFELGDRPIFNVGGYVSGHTFKHLFAGAASWFIYWHLHTRAPASNRGARPDLPA
ncbi:MAG: alkaline phytoceramidase [Planctomycetota bacterium]|nr:MAG: alkaline phytoceramidase [Planctomycetota bacterium]